MKAAQSDYFQVEKAETETDFAADFCYCAGAVYRWLGDAFAGDCTIRVAKSFVNTAL